MTYNPLAGYNPPAWMDDAICPQTDPEIFHPEKGGSTLEAKKVCAGCPVAADCLREALVTENSSERAGVWGMTSPAERELLTGLNRHRIRTTRADVVDRLATIGVDADAILAEIGEAAA